MKRITKFSFFFLLIFFGFLIIPYSLIDVQGYTPTIKADWLYVTTGEFNDNSPHDWENNVKISSGGGDLLSFENLGIISSNDDAVLYKSRCVFGFEVTMHTNVDFRKVYPDINLDNQYEDMFFRVQRIYVDGAVSSRHYVSWNSIELGTFREHNYDGNIPITVGIREILGNDGTITVGDQTFDTPTYVADVIKTTVTSIRSGEIGGYADRFTNVADVEEGTVKFQILDDDFTADEIKVINYLNDRNLGWYAGDIERGQTIQQEMVGGEQTGAEFTNVASSDSYMFNLDAQIQPEVYEYVQYNTITKAEVKYWKWGFYAGDMETLFGPTTFTAPKRIVAVHTTNSFIHWDFEVIVEFVATVESNAELTQAILGDPYLKAGDMVWDTSFTGDYDVDVPLQKETIGDILGDLFGGLFDDIYNILIVVAIIVVAIVILYVALKFRRRKGGQVIHTGGKIVR